MIIVSRKSFVMDRDVDTDPDLSHLGEYSNKTTSPAAIDREERGDAGRREYRYFNPAMTGEETGNPESPEQDYRRMEDYNRGVWSMIGIRAKVVLKIPNKNGGSIRQTIESPGVWGIESDSDDSYLQEVFADECQTLEEMLKELGTITIVD